MPGRLFRSKTCLWSVGSDCNPIFAFSCAPDGVQMKLIVPFLLVSDQSNGVVVDDVAGDYSVIERRRWRRRGWHPNSVNGGFQRSLVLRVTRARFFMFTSPIFSGALAWYCWFVFIWVGYMWISFTWLDRARFSNKLRNRDPSLSPTTCAYQNNTQVIDNAEKCDSPQTLSEGTIMWYKSISLPKSGLNLVTICNSFSKNDTTDGAE